MGASMKGNWMEWPGQNKAKNRSKRVRSKVLYVFQKEFWHDLEQNVDEHGFDSRYVPVAVFVFESKG